MANLQLLGLFHDATPTSDALIELRELGIEDKNVTVMSAMPYGEEVFGRPRIPRRVGRYALIGSFLGLLLGLFLTVGIFSLYPLRQGGQPIIPIPPTLIVLFETTMLGTMWAAFFALLAVNRFPDFETKTYDPRITEGHIGVLVWLDESLADKAEAILTDHGGHHMQRIPYEPTSNRNLIRFWGIVLGGVTLLGVLILFIGYDIIPLHFPTNMAEQDSIAYLQGPRKAAPALAVPVQGPALIDGQPATTPVPSSSASIQRGQQLFSITCQVCHGKSGNGLSPLTPYFSPPPADLTGDKVQGMTDAQIYKVVSQGFNVMPSMAENLSPSERWDVINYVRTLKK
ncbi:MAG: cytochrome c [Anaerolineales bacterium]|jgi:mono/diheme cytochrome c family protein